LSHVLAAAALPMWILLITCSALFLYPFVRQPASFSRLAVDAEESEVWS
jgi:hypothetical protein